jgi:hypothetical protein
MSSRDLCRDFPRNLGDIGDDVFCCCPARIMEIFQDLYWNASLVASLISSSIER